MSKLESQLKRHEGLKLTTYQCTAGKLTIGYGRNLDDVGINEFEASMMLRNDINTAKAQLMNFEWYYNLDQVRKECMINMCFNLGLTRLLKFTKMINAIKLRDYTLASKEMLDSKWAKQVKGRAVELSEQMRTGSYAD